MGLVKFLMYDSVRSGIKVFGKRASATKAQPTELERMVKEVLHQASTNNTQLAQQVDKLMSQHNELAKVLFDTLKYMGGH